MTFLNNISAILFLAALILLVLCIISFFKKNGKAMKYGRPAVICFIISFLTSATSTAETKHPIVNFFANVCLILFIFFLILAILSVIKKTGVAKKQFLITAVLFVGAIALGNIANPSLGKATATDKKIAAEKKEKEEKKQELEKKDKDEQARKQEEEQKRQADEQAQKQQEEQKRQADEQAQKQQEEQQRQADEQARKQQEEQKRQADEQARKQQEEQQRQADEQARKQQEEQQRQADEQARKQQEQQAAQQTQPAPAENNSNAYYKNCTEVKNAGKAPLYSGQPGYSRKLDRDGDGVACER
ncbi:excalibur calcium-binding domain-containing protein [Bacillus sp. DX4.1]|uniref:excalibur calcium-binding domain-containing protein n=1 Tax=Bacillus sp. DX4.1 TaxID=3055867 RepID=UPI0025A02B98|nr:excalibur calcium-binding domain-containing protein [Bacillus sp. DX4.1]MDM5188416.1 excalibur calcium-binding domain-containing protein [Bacillus sp. DX4.1]